MAQCYKPRLSPDSGQHGLDRAEVEVHLAPRNRWFEFVEGLLFPPCAIDSEYTPFYTEIDS